MLLDKYGTSGFQIVAFPCNQFLHQEPGSNQAIKVFAASRGFKGLLMDKIDVNGPHASPVYHFLKCRSGDLSPIPWNYSKFLVGRDGRVRGRFGAKQPAHDLVDNIEELLAEDAPGAEAAMPSAGQLAAGEAPQAR